jgi:hypothetical protein
MTKRKVLIIVAVMAALTWFAFGAVDTFATKDDV